jgi:multidrug resistance protein, MATE family
MFREAFRENKETLVLALPMMAGQLTFMLQGMADTVMIGRVGTGELAAAAFVNVLMAIPTVVGVGLSASVSVQVSHAFGAGNHRAMGEAVRHGLVWSVVMAVGVTALLWALIPVLGFFGQTQEVVAKAPPYLFWMAASMIPMLLTMGLKSYSEGQNKVWPVFGILASGVLVNIVLNYWFIFGGWGVPAMGLKGTGMATFLARLGSLAALWWYIHEESDFDRNRPRQWFAPLDSVEMRRLGRLMLPIMGQMLLEMSVFAGTALMVGWIGSVPLAAHQVAITCAATTFMLPLGLSMALTIRVGQAIGSGERERAGAMIFGAHVLSLLIMVTTATAFGLFRESLARAFSPDAGVVALASTLLIVAGVFQIFDGAQVISVGALRGLKDVKAPTVIVTIAYWGVTIPLGAGLCFGFDWGALGFWIGMAVGLALASAVLTWRVWSRLHQLSSP